MPARPARRADGVAVSTMRLQKFLARAGVGSRRGAEDLIVAGRVKVNGRIVRILGTVVGEGDRVELDSRPIGRPAAPCYLILHKPVGMVTTMRDPEGRRTVATLLPKDGPRVVPVGRLDYDTAGVLLLTNDGELANVLTHPRFGVEKTYRAVVRGRLSPADVRALGGGVALEDGAAAPAKIRVIATTRDRSEIDITVHEGRNRMVRRMLAATAHPVIALTRLRFGPIALGGLAAGQLREPTSRELAALRAIADGGRATDDDGEA
ncbi:MAG: pseudouridine synthase [Vulcanimicrobiaceae bacterium]